MVAAPKPKPRSSAVFRQATEYSRFSLLMYDLFPRPWYQIVTPDTPTETCDIFIQKSD